MLRASVPLPEASHAVPLLDALVETHSDASVDRTDGVKLSWDDVWLVARVSATEPVLRVFTESSDRDRARELLDETVAFLGASDRNSVRS